MATRQAPNYSFEADGSAAAQLRRWAHMILRYQSGHEVRAGDVLAPGMEIDGQTARVVVVIPTQESVHGYVASEWEHLEIGVMVEHINANGRHLVHYSNLDEDFELLHRSVS